LPTHGSVFPTCKTNYPIAHTLFGNKAATALGKP
jgi:hypothetical protein